MSIPAGHTSVILVASMQRVLVSSGLTSVVPCCPVIRQLSVSVASDLTSVIPCCQQTVACVSIQLSLSVDN